MQMENRDRSTARTAETYNIPTEPSSPMIFKGGPSRGVIVSSGITKISAQQGAIFRPGEKITFEIPSSAWFDASKSFISFKFKVKPEGDNVLYEGYKPGTTPDSWQWIRVKNGCPFFSRFTLHGGSATILEDSVEHDVVTKFLTICTLPKEYIKGPGFLFEGLHTEDDFFAQTCANMRSKSDANAGDATEYSGLGQQYFIQPQLGLFRTGKYFPVGYAGMLSLWCYINTPNRVLIRSIRGKGHSAFTNASIQISGVNGIPNQMLIKHNEYQLNGFNEADAADCSFVNATFELDNVFFLLSTVNPLEEFNQAISDKLQSGNPITIYFDTMRVDVRTVRNFITGPLDLQISNRVSSVKAIFCVFVQTGERESRVQELNFTHYCLSSYRLRIADVYYPPQDVSLANGGIEAYHQLMNALGIGQDTVAGHNMIDLKWGYRPRTDLLLQHEGYLRKELPTKITTHSHQFVLGMNFEQSPGQLSGLDLTRANSDIHFTFNFRPPQAGQFQRFGPMLPENNHGQCIIPGFSHHPLIYVSPNTTAGAVTHGNSPFADQRTAYTIQNFDGQNHVAAPEAIFQSGAAALSYMGYTPLVSPVTSYLTGDFLTSGYTSPAILAPKTDTGAPATSSGENQGLDAATLTNLQGVNGSVINLQAGVTGVDPTIPPALSLVYQDLAVPLYEAAGTRPNGFEMYCITHMDAAFVIETFGSMMVKYDLYNLKVLTS